MFKKLFSRRRGVGIVAAALGMSVASLAFAGAAGATTSTALPGGGSNTAYQVMQSLSNLFATSPGCNIATTAPINYACSNTYTAGAANGEDGYNMADENPYNDVPYQEPAIGSGNGVNELNQSGGTALDYARASSGPALTHGTSQNNYIAYAVDGVSWVCFTQSSGFCDSKVKSITLADLNAIYDDTFSCTIGGSTVTMDWRCLNGNTGSGAQPIDCYMAQNGSGTEKTWASQVVNLSTGTANDTPACLSDEAHTVAGHSHTGLFENEISDIVDPTSVWYNNDIANAVYFFSEGKYATECKSNKCPDDQGNTTYFGQIQAECAKCKPVTANAKSVGLDVTDPTNAKAFPVYRYLNNVVRNSSASSASSNSVLNFVGEYGFLCKPLTNTDDDPLNPGVSYRTEIAADISAAGFLPLAAAGSPLSNEWAQAGIGGGNSPGVLNFPDKGTSSDAGFSQIDPTLTNGTAPPNSPPGYCLAFNGNDTDLH